MSRLLVEVMSDPRHSALADRLRAAVRVMADARVEDFAAFDAAWLELKEATQALNQAELALHGAGVDAQLQETFRGFH